MIVTVLEEGTNGAQAVEVAASNGESVVVRLVNNSNSDHYEYPYLEWERAQERHYAVLAQVLGAEKWAEYQKYNALIADAYVRMSTNNSEDYMEQQFKKIGGWFSEMVKLVDSLGEVTYDTGHVDYEGKSVLGGEM